MKKIGLAMTVLFVSSALRADEIFLRAGGSIRGEIVARSANSVTVDIGGGEMSIEMAYVARIESGVSDLGAFRARAAKLASGDAGGWRGLARWAESRGLEGQALEAWKRLLAVVPDDEEANRALGRVLLDGEWVTAEESYRARGYVQFEGEWMTPEARSAVLAERAALERYDRESLAARLRNQEMEEQARFAAEQAAAADSWYAPEYGYPVYWNYPPTGLPGRPVRPVWRHDVERPAPLPAPSPTRPVTRPVTQPRAPQAPPARMAKPPAWQRP